MFLALKSIVWGLTGVISAGYFASLANAQIATLIVTLLFYLRPMEKATYPYPIMMVGLVIAMFAVAFHRKPYGTLDSAERKDTKLVIMMQAYLLFNIVIFNRWNLLEIYQSYVLPAFLLFLLISEYVVTVKALRALLLVIGVSCLFTCADSLFVHFRLSPESQIWILYHDFEGDGARLRNMGLWNNPNILAYLSNLGILCFYIVSTLSKGFARLAYLTPWAAFLPTVFLTGSRGALLQLGISGAIIFFSEKKNMATIIVASAILFVAATYLTVLSPDRKYAEGSKEERIEILLYAKDAFLSHPVFGVGFKVFPDYNPFHLVAHNTFAELFVELGIVGAVIFFLMLKTAIKGCYLTMKNTRGKSEFIEINRVTTGIFALSIGAFVYYTFGNQLLDFLFFTTLGLMVAAKRAYELMSANQTPNTEPNSVRSRAFGQ